MFRAWWNRRKVRKIVRELFPRVDFAVEDSFDRDPKVVLVTFWVDQSKFNGTLGLLPFVNSRISHYANQKGVEVIVLLGMLVEREL